MQNFSPFLPLPALSPGLLLPSTQKGANLLQLRMSCSLFDWAGLRFDVYFYNIISVFDNNSSL